MDDEASGILFDNDGSSNVGWVTLVKDGRKLVTSRVRQSAGSRQQHAQQWARRVANEQAQKRTVKSSHTISLELSSDPSGIGFAFGGIHPGTLHAHGHLFENHHVSYSIGLVGEVHCYVPFEPTAQRSPTPSAPGVEWRFGGTAPARHCIFPEVRSMHKLTQLLLGVRCLCFAVFAPCTPASTGRCFAWFAVPARRAAGPRLSLVNAATKRSDRGEGGHG